MIQSIPQERVSERIVEHIVDVPGGPGCGDRVESEREELHRICWERVQEGQAKLITWQFGSLFDCKLFCCSGHDRLLS